MSFNLQLQHFTIADALDLQGHAFCSLSSAIVIEPSTGAQCRHLQADHWLQVKQQNLPTLQARRDRNIYPVK